MGRMFCTVEEAAEKLDANPEQIETLLARGILHEFRDGPYRLLKEVEVGALATAHRNTIQSRHPNQNAAGALPPGRHRVQTGKVTSDIRLPRSPTVTAGTSAGHAVHGRSTRKLQSEQPTGSGLSERGSMPNRTRHLLPPTGVGRQRQRVTMSHSQRASQAISVRQWLWIGLTQDRPAAIALLAGFLLLVLSALVVGICMLHETV